MSKSEAKQSQGYEPKPMLPVCENCVQFIRKRNGFTYYRSSGIMEKDYDLKCGIGGFAVKKQGCCNLHAFKK